jgi:hypothetical protein
MRRDYTLRHVETYGTYSPKSDTPGGIKRKLVPMREDLLLLGGPCGLLEVWESLACLQCTGRTSAPYIKNSSLSDRSGFQESLTNLRDVLFGISTCIQNDSLKRVEHAKRRITRGIVRRGKDRR